MPLKLVKRGKSANWYMRGTIRGIAVDESTGTDNREAAEAIRIKREAEILERSIHGTRTTATFLEAAVNYMEVGGETRFMRRLIDHFGTTKLDQIGQAAIDRAARILYPDATASTLNRQVYTPVSAVLKFAARRGMVESRPISRPKQPPSRVRWITPAEAEILIAKCSVHLRPLVVFMLYTGARVSEALYLDWRELDLQRAHVAFLDTKNGGARGVPMHPRVVVELANLPHREGSVFRRPDGRPYEWKADGGGQIKTAFKGACRRAGIENFRPHDLRHTWASWHYQQNRDIAVLMTLGGWKSERMVLRYAHLNTDNLAATVAALPWEKSGDQSAAELKNRRKSGG